MGTSANLSQIIRFYAEKQNSPFIDFGEFCAYLKKYSEHHVEEQAELVKYLGDPSSTVSAELEGLKSKHIAALMSYDKKKLIVSVAYLSIQFAKRFKEILENESVPYPVVSDLPSKFPVNLLEQKDASDYIKEILESQNTKSQCLYVVRFKDDSNPMLLPACIPVKLLMDTTKKKLRRVLSKDEFHDYYLKKLRGSNPGKELIIQHFFQNFVEDKYQSDNIEDTLSSDDYYYWSQLCYFIRQDFEKIQDKTIEDINILQAIEITEINNVYLKQKMQTAQRKEEALKQLAFNLQKPPYIYTIDQILKFKDNNGRLLYGQFDEEDFKAFLLKETGEAAQGELPRLLVFKVESGTKYYIYKNKVLPLTVRLCNEAHNAIETTLENRWYDKLFNYGISPDMKSRPEFEKVVADEIAIQAPVLWALVNANFMTLLSYEKGSDESMDGGRIFDGNELLPYSEMLLLRQNDILAQAKIRLPFWYTIPVLSWICALFSSKKKSKKAEAKSKSGKGNTNSLVDSVLGDDDDELLELEDNKKSSSGKKKAKKDVLAEMAEDLSKEFLTEGTTIDRELDFLCKQWNKMITKQASMQLTEDVNSLIRDYMRKVINTLTASTFTAERVRSLAKSLVKTPNMQKIKEEEALTRYVELYILRLVSNR